MSRVGRQPIVVPDSTKLTYEDRVLTVEGALGKLSQAIHRSVDLRIENGVIHVTRQSDDRATRSIQGLTRSLVANMIIGVNQGFERTLLINGIGYRAELKGSRIILHLGFSQPVQFDLPEGITASIDRTNTIKLTGISKEKVGHTAAAIRRLRPPEPYKGKGIRYADEFVRKKAGKAGTK
ncbi:MAG: 50S ribosomal protein L6 [Deltaproteobacteria bacterium]|nr:50S ribosomal protein L6 [Deltaproteobacteria bacterium]MBW1961740.1 50S ribosomal protein L6 [Deltaproteobacteria bacterium]MBW1994540.1 50S ribosomal protein L6 [Deltaproteobacteria bacterium]MBW2151108.1 50S ribosomal protein L6 [Deltaproteobacteria bacterium]